MKSVLSKLIIMPLLFFTLMANAGETVSEGTFVGASDHVTTGGVSIVNDNGQYKVVLASDFSLDGAPDPKVGLGVNGKYDENTELAHLQSNTGEQTYTIPASINVDDYNEVYIWCRKYSVPLGVAVLK